MISRFFLQSAGCLRINVTSTQFGNVIQRQFSLKFAKLARYSLREQKFFRENFRRQQESFKTINTKNELFKSDSIPVRPSSHLWRALGFTIIVSF